MFEDLFVTGKHIDDAMTIEATLVNPADYGLDEGLIAFKLEVREIECIDLNKLSFYIEGKDHRIYNAEVVTREDGTIGENADNRVTTMLAAYTFRAEFVYNRVRLGFLYEPYGRIEFIELGF